MCGVVAVVCRVAKLRIGGWTLKIRGEKKTWKNLMEISDINA